MVYVDVTHVDKREIRHMRKKIGKIRDLDPEMRSGMEPRPYAKGGFVGSGFHP